MFTKSKASLFIAQNLQRCIHVRCVIGFDNLLIPDKFRISATLFLNLIYLMELEMALY